MQNEGHTLCEPPAPPTGCPGSTGVDTRTRREDTPPGQRAKLDGVGSLTKVHTCYRPHRLDSIRMLHGRLRSVGWLTLKPPVPPFYGLSLAVDKLKAGVALLAS